MAQRKIADCQHCRARAHTSKHLIHKQTMHYILYAKLIDFAEKHPFILDAISKMAPRYNIPD